MTESGAKAETNNPKNPYRMNNYFRVDCEYGNDKNTLAPYGYIVVKG